MRTDFDIAVVGAGPAGAATAHRLSQRGCSVVLVERSHFDTPRVGESLAPAIQPLLWDLGVWPQFKALAPLPSYGTRSVWGGEEVQDHSHLMSAYGCGWHVDRREFDRMLAQAAATAGAELRCDTSVVHCESLNGRGWLLRVNEKEAGLPCALRARVLIDATGRSARLTRWLAARRIVFDRLLAAATLLRDVDTSREGYILVETTPDGWWYSAPLPRNRMMVMLMTDSDLCGRANLSDPFQWRKMLAHAPKTIERLSGTVEWGPHLFSALSQRLHRRELHAPWIAVGDAALAVDPISGSGVLRGLRSARTAAEVALKLLDDHQAVEAYEDELDRQCTTYLEERAMYYAAEQRWRESPFWQRRAVAIEACSGTGATLEEAVHG